MLEQYTERNLSAGSSLMPPRVRHPFLVGTALRSNSRRSPSPARVAGTPTQGGPVLRDGHDARGAGALGRFHQTCPNLSLIQDPP